MVRVLDHYALLGIPVDSSAAVIKKTYRTLALKHHPDKNPGNDNAQKNFQMLQNAYDVLVDDNTRRSYDRARILGGVMPSYFLPSTTKAPAENAHRRTGRGLREIVSLEEEKRRQKAKEAEHITRRREEEKRRQKAKEAERIARWREEERRRQEARRLEEEKRNIQKVKEAEENMVKWWVEQEEKRQRAREAGKNKTKWWEEDEKRQRERSAEEEMARWLEEEMEKVERERAERERAETEDVKMEDYEWRGSQGIWRKMFQAAQDIDTIDWMEIDEDSFGLKGRNFQAPFGQPGVHPTYMWSV